MAESAPKYFAKIAKTVDNQTIDLMIANFKESYGLSQREMETLISITPPGELYPLLFDPTEEGPATSPIEKALARLRVDHEVNRKKLNMRVVRNLRNKLSKLLLPELETDDEE